MIMENNNHACLSTHEPANFKFFNTNKVDLLHIVEMYNTNIHQSISNSNIKYNRWFWEKEIIRPKKGFSNFNLLSRIHPYLDDSITLIFDAILKKHIK